MLEKDRNATFNLGCELRFTPREFKSRDLGYVACASCKNGEWVLENETAEEVVGRLVKTCDWLSESYKQKIFSENSELDSVIRGDGSYEIVPVLVKSRSANQSLQSE